MVEPYDCSQLLGAITNIILLHAAGIWEDRDKPFPIY